ncbi:MAG: hypothetical protein LBG57_10575 [Treponema sp.]|nr:hypothetical protein [Treponema sp.]
MRLFLKMVLFVSFINLFGCTSISQNTHYSKLAKEHSFEYFFPSSDFRMKFSTIDDTYEFVNVADKKFAQVISNKRRDKGLGAKLIGPSIEDAPVTLVCMIRASNNNGSIDLSRVDKDLSTVLQQAEDALLFFFIFYDGKAIALSNFYLDPKYSGYTDGNRQVQKFGLFGNTYEAEYPVGWGIEKVFEYLKGEKE